jgi:hypothetical protein
MNLIRLLFGVTGKMQSSGSKASLPLLLSQLRGHTRFVVIGSHDRIKNVWASLVEDAVCSASGSSTPGLSLSLAKPFVFTHQR